MGRNPFPQAAVNDKHWHISKKGVGGNLNDDVTLLVLGIVVTEGEKKRL